SHPIQTARLSAYPRSLNHVLIFGKANTSATAPSLLAEAFDTADTLRIHDQPHIVHDMQLAAANALVRAAAVLRKAQILVDTGEYESGSSGGLRRRFTAGGGQPGRVPSSRGKRLRYPPHERARRIPAGKPAQSRTRAPRKRAAEPNVRGNHHAHKTEKPPKG